MGHFYVFSLPWLAIMVLDLLPPIGFLLVASTRKLASERAHAAVEDRGCRRPVDGSVPLARRAVEHRGRVLLDASGALLADRRFDRSRHRRSRRPCDEFIQRDPKGREGGAEIPLGLVGPGPEPDQPVSASARWCWWPRRSPGGRSSGRSPGGLGTSSLRTRCRSPSGCWWWPISGSPCNISSSGSASEARSSWRSFCSPPGCSRSSSGRSLRRPTPRDGRRTRPPDVWSPAIASLSPIAGIALSSGITTITGLNEARTAALLPALAFALLFNNLVTSTRRKVEKEIHPEAAPEADPVAKPDPEPDGLAEPAMAT